MVAHVARTRYSKGARRGAMMANETKSVAGKGAVGDPGEEAIHGVIWAFAFGEDGVARPIGRQDPFLSESRLVWLHVNLVDQRACRWLAAQPGLPAVAREFLMTREPQQYFASEGGMLMMALDDFTRDVGAISATRTGILHVVASDRMVITGRHLPLRATDVVGLKGERGELIAHSGADILGRLLEEHSKLVDGIVDELDHTAQSIEDMLLVRQYNDNTRLVLLRRRLVQLHRLLRGTRATLHRLERDSPGDVPDGFIQIGERFVQRYDALDADVLTIQEQARLLQEEINADAAFESNRSLTLLSGMTALFLPPTLVVGYFGMNTSNLFWTENPFGTILATIVVVLSIYVTYRILRRNKFI